MPQLQTALLDLHAAGGQVPEHTGFRNTPTLAPPLPGLSLTPTEAPPAQISPLPLTTAGHVSTLHAPDSHIRSDE